MIRRILREEIRTEFDELKKIQIGTDEYKTTVDSLTKLMDKAIDLEKLDNETEEKNNCRIDDIELRREQLSEEKKDRKWRNAIAVATIVVPTAVTIWGTLKSFKFEEDGTITTIMGRGFIQKLLPKK